MTFAQKLLFTSLIASVLLVAALLLSMHTPVAIGSAIQGQEYIATTTAPSSTYGATISASTLIRTGSGSLASVVITGANTGVVNFYNATTTNVNLRTPGQATSTILLASFPASTVAGTYIFDVVYSRGLLIDLVSGTMPTSTVTYR